MAHAKVTKTGTDTTGTTNTFSYSGNFDVFKGEEVKVSLDAVNLTRVTTTINDSANPREYTVDNTAKTVTIGGGTLGSGNTVIIRPETDMGEPSPRATYSPGSSITSADLNNNQLQLMRKAMEYDDTKMSTTGDTMTGDLTFDPSIGIKFKELAANGTNTATLKGPDSTADVTITLPSVTGTVVTTGDSLTVATGMIANDAITGAKIADNEINSEHYAADSIDTEHYAPNSVDTAALANDAVTGAQIGDDQVDSEHIAADSLDTEHYAPNSVDADALAHTSVTAGSYTAADITVDAQGRLTAASSGTIAGSEIAGDAIDGSKIADGSIDSEHFVNASIDNAHLANNAVDTEEIADDAVTIAKIGDKQTTISDSDSHVPTSGAVVDYVTSRLAGIGGLEVIDDDESFEEVADMPPAGVVVSITDAAGLSVNSSGVSTNGDTKTTNATVTINGFPSELRGGVDGNANPYVFQSGAGLMVVSTGSSNTYNYHQALIREADFVDLSDDISDFNARYRVTDNASGVRTGKCTTAGVDPGDGSGTFPCDGDMAWFKDSDKMFVFDPISDFNAASNADKDACWKEVASTGQFKTLVAVNPGTTTAADWGNTGLSNGNSGTSWDLKETSNTGTAASITSAEQLIVSVNGVIQKPNALPWSGSGEGFYLQDADTIRFATAPSAGSSVFITQIGSAVTVPTPADNSVTAAKTDISIVQGDIIYGNGTDTWTRLAKGTAGQTLTMNSGATAPEWVATTDATKMPLAGGTFTGDVYFDNSAHAGFDISWDESAKTWEFDDNVKCTFGNGSDLSIYHDATDSFLDNDQGDLYIKTSGSGDDVIIQAVDDIFLKPQGGENGIEIAGNGAVTVYHDNTKEFSTVAGGVKLWGHSEQIVTALTSAASVTIDFSVSNHFSCTMGHTIAFQNPTTEAVGQSGTITLTQPGSGSNHSASWGNQFLWAGGTPPTLTDANNAVDRIDYVVVAGGAIHCVASLDCKASS